MSQFKKIRICILLHVLGVKNFLPIINKKKYFLKKWGKWQCYIIVHSFMSRMTFV